MEEKTFISNNHLNGVFRVHQEMPIFQVRGYDMANISFPYVNRFRRKPGERPDGTAPKGEGKGAEYYPFDKDDLNTWKKYCLEVFEKANRDDNIWQIYNENIRFCGNGDASNKNLGIGQDGEFYGSELLHFLYLCYRFLYVINNKQNQ
ncbi:hypothetical protein [Parabacteroides sp.]|uniref:hypothetical protein n=1 Tax=Parabacteroides sp. TaxID=1869337 RepID=UPI00307FE4A6